MSTIEELCEDINQQLNEVDSSVLISPVIRLARDVFRRIGFEYVCDQEETHLEIKNNAAKKPKLFVSLIDVGYTDQKG